jgi:hypothetical protein
MAINLKEILISDVDNIKLDKVNYNFDQLVANGGGPQGYQGPNGALGYQGVTGYQGYQGELGYQGDQGPQGNNGQGIWKINSGTVGTSTTDTILPMHDESLNSHTPSVIIGYKSTDPEYDDEYIESDSQLVIHRHDNFASNLTLKSSEVEDSSFVFTLRSGDTAGSGVVDMKFDGAGLGSLNQYADIFTWNYGTNNAPLITLDNTVLDVSVDSEFKDVSITGSLKIQPDVDVNGNNIDVTDHIAVSADSDGTVVFKSIADIGGVVPIGTIVSMIPSQFADNTKFINEQLNVTSPPNHPLHIEIGKGIGAHTGWYLCNGKTWTNGTDLFPTPDLNSFSYSIDNDPNINTSDSQGEVPLVSNTEISIIGGADAEMSADYNNATSQFDITASVTAGITSFQSQTGTTYTIKRLPQIIFFGEPNLYWTDAGTNAIDQNIVNMTFNDWWNDTTINPSLSVNIDGDVTLNAGNNTGSSIYYPASTSRTPTQVARNDDAGTRQINVTVSMVVPAGHGNTGDTLTRTFTITQQTEYTAPSNYTLTLSASGRATNATYSSPDTDTAASGNNAQVQITVSPLSGYQFTSVNDIIDNLGGGSIISKTLSNGNIVYSVSSTLNSNQSYSLAISGGGASAIPATNIQVDYQLSLHSSDAKWVFDGATTSSYIGQPNGSHSIPFTVEFIGANATPNITGISSTLGTVNFSQSTSNPIQWNGTVSISDVGATNKTGSTGLAITLDIAEATPIQKQNPNLSYSGNVSTNGQNASQPAGFASSKTVSLTLDPMATDVDWSVTNVPSWVTVSPSSGTGDTTLTVTTLHPNALNSNRSGSFNITTVEDTQWNSETVTVQVEQDNTFLSTSGPSGQNVGPEGDSETITVMTNLAWSTFVDSVSAGDSTYPLSGSATPSGNVAVPQNVELYIDSNNSSSSRILTFGISAGNFQRFHYFTQPGATGEGAYGGSGGDNLA